MSSSPGTTTKLENAASDPDAANVQGTSGQQASLPSSAVHPYHEGQAFPLEELVGQPSSMIGLMTGPEHRWTYVNDQFIRTTGRMSARDFLGKSLLESLSEMRDQPYPELLDQVYRSGEPAFGREMKVFLNRAGSPEGYFDFVFQPVCNAAGRVEGVLLHAVEVTDRVAARKIVEDNAERFRQAQAAAQIGVWEWDAVQGTSTLSTELHRMFGTDPASPDHAAQWESRVHPDDHHLVMERLAEASRTGSMEFEYRYRHPELGLRWFYCKGSTFKDESRMFGIVQDVTDRKLATEAVRASEVAAQRLAAIVESSDDAIVSKDLRGVVTSWNRSAEKMFGYSAQEMIGQPILRIIPPELQADEVRILDTITRGERIEHFETVRVAKNGERLHVSLTISPVKDQSGRIVGAAKIARDITQQKKAELALRTSEKLASVGRLAATVAHEINNPLEAVTNLVYLAKQHATRDDVRQYLAMAEEELDRVSHLTKQTLGFYRETKGASLVSLGAILNGLLAVFRPRARNKSVEIRPETPQHGEIRAVPGEMRQLMANLLSNSIDATPEGGLVRIRISNATEPNGKRRSGVRLTVADTGCGIPEAVRSKLFEPFFTTKKEVGTGLGLWVCKSIVEQHEGNVHLKSSTKKGKTWTVFSVFLPAAPQEATADEGLKRAV